MGRAVRISYERGSGPRDPVERTVGPLGLVLKGGMWYVIGVTDGQIRTYRAKRVLEATLLDERVERPPGFDLAAYWQESSAAYERDVPTVEVTVRVPAGPGMADRGRLRTGRRSQTAERLDEPDPDGWTRLRLTLSWPEEVPGKLLSIGSGLEVLDPAEIRDHVLSTASRIVERYRDASRSRPAAEPSGLEPKPAEAPPLTLWRRVARQQPAGSGRPSRYHALSSAWMVRVSSIRSISAVWTSYLPTSVMYRTPEETA